MDCFASDSVIYFTSVKRTLFDPLTISARSAASCWLQGLEIEEIINMRKITRRSFLTAAAACGAAAALSACGGSSSASSSAAASSTVASASVAAASNGEKFTVGICQLVQHAALDAATQGYEDALPLARTSPSTSRMHRVIPLPAPPLPTALFPPAWH